MTSSLLPRYVAEIFCTNPAVPISSVASYLGYKQSRLALQFAYSCSFIRFLNSSSNSLTRGGDCCSHISPSGQSLSLPAADQSFASQSYPEFTFPNYGPTPSPTVVAGPVLGTILHSVCLSLHLKILHDRVTPLVPSSLYTDFSCLATCLQLSTWRPASSERTHPSFPS